MRPDSRSEAANLLSRLGRLGVKRWQEVLLCVPKSYFDYSKITPVSHAHPLHALATGHQLFRLSITDTAYVVTQPKKRIVLTASDGVYSIKIVVFVVPGVDIRCWKAFQLGETILVLGSLHLWQGVLQITGPVLVPPALLGTIIPVYEKRRGVVADGSIYDASRFALEHHLTDTVDYLTKSYHGLNEREIMACAHIKASSLETVLRAAHQPATEEEGYRGIAGMKRLAALSIVENAKRMKIRNSQPDSVVKIPIALIDELASMLPYPLTQDQRAAIEEIVEDMASTIPMRRVLTGDVGCGKSLVIQIPVLATQRLGRTAVVLTPNSLLAVQFATECKQLFGEQINIIVVTSSTRKIDFTGNPILVGTTAILSRLKHASPPSLFAIDEQQKFSVGQKSELAAITSNYIEATATPIPRTTAMITHGSIDLSIIRTMPVRKKILTKIVRRQEAKRLFDHTLTVLGQGSQVAIVYPMVNDPEKEKRSVTQAYGLWNARFPGKVSMLHGQMKEPEKIAAVDGLKRGDYSIAIVTTVIELGLTLSNLRSMIVVNPERHGTSTLHQLRGRVARSGGTGYFFLYVSETVSEETMTRLLLLENHSDGFELAEKDAEIRGYGDLFEHGERQSGASRSNVFHCVDLSPADIHRITERQLSPNKREENRHAKS